MQQVVFSIMNIQPNSFPFRSGTTGCPLSPYIFILGIEILCIAIRHNDDIRGINTFGKTVKNTIFTDDCTIIIEVLSNVITQQFISLKNSENYLA